MCGLLALLFIVIPALEIYVLIAVGGSIGAVPTLGIIILTGMAGAYLARTQGVAAARKLQASMARGEAVGASLAGAALVLVAGVLMLTPGFLTDALGLALLVPPIRARVAAEIVRRAASRARHHVVMHGFGPGFGPPGFGPDTAGRPQGRPADERVDRDPPPPGVIDV